ncbi:hypothetical protein [Aeromicrobium sp. Sec7.5]|uniref:hypothetical protein n=1 Tax=Aeromicrobium sp. Sec7.5 TaxID=3121276 RepID=UPI002FE4C6F1
MSSTVYRRLRARLLRVALAVGAPLVVLGLVAMHSLMTLDEGHAASHSSQVAQVGDPMTGDGHGHGSAAHATTADAGGDHGAPADDRGCGPLMAMCIAMLVSIAIGVVLVRARGLRRVIEQLPVPTMITLGWERPAWQSLTPRQRTSVLRC